jgi:hypothetical protein
MHLVELAEEFGEDDADGRPGDGKFGFDAGV